MFYVDDNIEGLALRGKQTEEQRKTNSERVKLMWKNPEYRNRLRLAHLGYQHSKAAKMKLSLALKGKPKSEEHRRKIALANQGKNLGRHHSEEHNKKVGLANFGQKRTEETKRKISLGNKGKKLTLETRKKISLKIKSFWQDSKYKDKLKLAHLGYSPSEAARLKMKSNWQNPEWVAKVLESRKKSSRLGKHRSPETIQKIKQSWTEKRRKLWGEMIKKRHQNNPEWRQNTSEQMKKFWKDPNSSFNCEERSVKLRKALIGKKQSFETIEKLRLKRIGRKITEETRRKLSEFHKLQWQDSEFIAKILKGRDKLPNKPETKLLNLLNVLYPTDWKYVGNGEWWITYAGKHLNPDFVNVNGRKLIIEMNGDYYHRNDNGEFRKEAFASFGYDTLIVWEHELKDLEQVQSKIKEWIDSQMKEVKY